LIRSSARTAPRKSPLQLATISSIAVSFDLKLIEKSSGSNQDNLAGLSCIP
jgi:hypothetical protein